jgi:hypothetical protein
LARNLLWLGLSGYVGSAVCNVILLNAMAPEYRRMFDELSSNHPYQPVLPPTATAASALGQVAALAVLASGVVFLVWFHRTVANAQALGLPARRSPAWAIAGFLLPVVNWWFPYQSMRDAFPPGHPARRHVGAWWAAWLGAQLMIIPTLVLAFVAPLGAGVIAGVSVVIYVLAMFAARRVVAEASAAHRDLAVQAGAVPADFDLAAEDARRRAGGGGGGEAVPDPWAKAADADPWNRP